MILFLSIFLTQFSACETSSGTAALTTLHIEISGVRSSKGHVLIAVFKSADGFPDKREKAILTKRIPSKIGAVAVELPNLPAGSYAFAVIHDENDNLKLDTGFLGIPKEGFCFSRQAMGSFGPPGFKDASFMVTLAVEHQKVKMSYW